MMQFLESTMPIHALPAPARRAHVPGLAVGDMVFSKYGRRMRVQSTDEYVCIHDEATGPYCALQAMDDKNAGGIWPRHWYTLPGETMQLDLSGTP